MATHSGKEEIKWHTEILPRATKKALDFLSKKSWLQKSDWYLAGGTALALQVGNRQSVDLDFFTPKMDFANTAVLKHFDSKVWESSREEEGTIYGKLLGAKVSFIAYPFFVPKQPLVWYGKVRMLQPIDIAVMKMIAISQRGRKRDFYDLYWCGKNVEPLGKMFSRLKEQYPTVVHNYYHIISSLTYFVDAEADPAPVILFRTNWEEVKNFFQKEAKKIAMSVLK